jgi:hypothetical protein
MRESAMPFGRRRDGDLVTDAPPTRRIMPFLMRTRNEAAVYFEQQVDAGALVAFVAAHRAQTGLKTTLLHVLLWAVARVLDERPRLNRFVAGHRIWQRRGVWLSFSMKKEKADGAPVVVVKKRIDPAWTLDEVVRAVDAGVADGRSGKEQQSDRELQLALMLPTFLTALAIAALRRLDAWGLLPRALIDPDPLFASAFVAPLGSIGMDAPFHHLYEYGNIPIFVVSGAVKDVVVLDAQGVARSRQVLPLRYTLDERIEDGLYCARALDLLRGYLEEPARIAVAAGTSTER